MQGAPKFLEQLSSTLLSSHKITGKNVFFKSIFFFVVEVVATFKITYSIYQIIFYFFVFMEIRKENQGNVVHIHMLI
jgi:hypothetical protein